MIQLQTLIDYCTNKKESSIEFPFGDVPVCFKFKGYIFAEIYPNKGNYKITVRCDAIMGEYYRKKYPGIVEPGYHTPRQQRRYKNTIMLEKEIEDKEVFKMIDESYETLLAKKQKNI